MSRLQNIYKEKVIAELTEKFGYKSVMEVPRITKITLNMGAKLAHFAQGAVHRCSRTPELFRQLHLARKQGSGAPGAIGDAVQDFCHDVPEGGLLKNRCRRHSGLPLGRV